jgi:hypothetical protein
MMLSHFRGNMSNFKVQRIDSPKHLAYIRTLPCHVQQDDEHCNGAPVHAHHLTIIKGERGVSQKAGDNHTLPLCSLHHRTLHNIGEKTFWKNWGVDAIEESKKLWELNN